MGRPDPSDEQAIELWLERVTERADPVMGWLGIVFALLVGYEIAVDVGPAAAQWLLAAGWTIWGIFVTEYLVKLWLAPKKARYVRRHWFQALALLVPTLRVLRFLRLLRLNRALPAARVVTSSYRSVGTARRLFRSRLGYLVATAVVVAIATAELAFLFERQHPDGIFASFGDAVLWAFAFGLVVVASLAGTVGAYLVEERRERAAVAGESD